MNGHDNNNNMVGISPETLKSAKSKLKRVEINESKANSEDDSRLSALRKAVHNSVGDVAKMHIEIGDRIDSVIQEVNKARFNASSVSKNSSIAESLEAERRTSIASSMFPDIPSELPSARSKSSRSSSISSISWDGVGEGFQADIMQQQVNHLGREISDIQENFELLNQKMDHVIKLNEEILNKMNSGFVKNMKDNFGKLVDNAKKPFVALNKAFNSFKESVKDGAEHMSYSFKEAKNKVVGSLRRCKEAVGNFVNSSLELTGKALMVPVEKAKQMNNKVKDVANVTDKKVKNFVDKIKISALKKKINMTSGVQELKSKIPGNNPGKRFDKLFETLNIPESKISGSRSEPNHEKSSKIQKKESFAEKQKSRFASRYKVEEHLKQNEKTAQEVAEKFEEKLKDKSLSRKERKSLEKERNKSLKSLAKEKKEGAKFSDHVDELHSNIFPIKNKEAKIDELEKKIQKRKDDLSKSSSKASPKSQFGRESLKRRNSDSQISTSDSSKKLNPFQRSKSESQLSTDNKDVKKESSRPSVAPLSSKSESSPSTTKHNKGPAPQPPVASSTRSEESRASTVTHNKGPAPQPPVAASSARSDSQPSANKPISSFAYQPADSKREFNALQGSNSEVQSSSSIKSESSPFSAHGKGAAPQEPPMPPVSKSSLTGDEVYKIEKKIGAENPEIKKASEGLKGVKEASSSDKPRVAPPPVADTSKSRGRG